MSRKSNQKGHRYESRVVELLTEFTKEKFRRVPQSGSFNKTGGTKIAEYIFSGDVICDNPTFLYSIEAKNQEALSMTAILKTPYTAIFTKFWEQCVNDAVTTNRRPMMFFKPNVSDDWIAILQQDTEYFNLSKAPRMTYNLYNGEDFEIMKDVLVPIKEGSKVNKKVRQMVKVSQLPDPIVLDWKTFVKYADPNKMFSCPATPKETPYVPPATVMI